MGDPHRVRGGAARRSDLGRRPRCCREDDRGPSHAVRPGLHDHRGSRGDARDHRRCHAARRPAGAGDRADRRSPVGRRRADRLRRRPARYRRSARVRRALHRCGSRPDHVDPDAGRRRCVRSNTAARLAHDDQPARRALDQAPTRRPARRRGVRTRVLRHAADRSSTGDRGGLERTPQTWPGRCSGHRPASSDAPSPTATMACRRRC